MNRFIYSEWKQRCLEVIEENYNYYNDHDMDFNEDVINDMIYQEIDNAVIYYADAWAIAYELADNDWSDLYVDFGGIKNISQLAYAALFDKVTNDYQMNGENLIEYFKQQAV